jgi:3-oxoadipate enol-lactonase
MYYEIHGQGEPIVFISGFSADHTVWGGVVEILKAHYQIILLDNRGAGQTDVPVGPYSIEQMTSDVVLLCAKLGIERAHFVGNSMGGFILQTLAYRHPNLVKSAIISNSAMDIHCVFHLYVAAQLQLLKANAPLAVLIHASCCWAFSFRFLSEPDRLDQLIQLGLDNPFPFTLTGYEGQYAALCGFNSTAWVGDITVPVLVIGGDQDLIFREPSIKALASSIPNAEYYCFQECGHLPFLEYPERFAELVDKFIS